MTKDVQRSGRRSNHRRPDQHRHPVPVAVPVLLLEWLAGARLPQFLGNVLGIGRGPFRRGDVAPADPACLQILTAVADHVPGRRRLPRRRGSSSTTMTPSTLASRSGPSSWLLCRERRLGPPFLGQVGQDRVGPGRPSLVVERVGDGGDVHPTPLAGAPVPHADHHVGRDLAGPQRLRHRQVFLRERRAVLAHRVAARDDRPRWRRRRGQSPRISLAAGFTPITEPSAA